MKAILSHDSKAGRARSNDSALPPTKNVSLPSRAATSPPLSWAHRALALPLLAVAGQFAAQVAGHRAVDSDDPPRAQSRDDT